MKPLRLLLIAPGPPPYGGLCRWTVSVLSWLESQPQVAVSQVDISPHWRSIQDQGVLKRFIGGSIQGVHDLWPLFIRLLRFRPSVVHVTSTGGLAALRDIAVFCLARLWRVPAIQHLHCGRIPEQIRANGLPWWTFRLSTRLAHTIVVIDPATESALRTFFPTGKLVYVPNGIKVVPLDQKVISPGDPLKKVCFLGWVIPAKGIWELMEAWRLSARSGWELIVVGPGDEVYKGKMVEHAGPKGKVSFLGEVPYTKAEEFVRQADILVLPSHSEGFPYVILEGMAAGKAIVSTRVGAIPSMLDDRGTRPCGLLVEPKDPDDLAEALGRLMDDPALRVELGRRARAKVESHYDSKIVFQRLLRIWEGAVPESATAGSRNSLCECPADPGYGELALPRENVANLQGPLARPARSIRRALTSQRDHRHLNESCRVVAPSPLPTLGKPWREISSPQPNLLSGCRLHGSTSDGSCSGAGRARPPGHGRV